MRTTSATACVDPPSAENPPHRPVTGHERVDAPPRAAMVPTVPTTVVVISLPEVADRVERPVGARLEVERAGRRDEAATSPSPTRFAMRAPNSSPDW